MPAPEFTTRWIRARRALNPEPVILAGVAPGSVGSFPSWLSPAAHRIKFDFRIVKYPELNQYPPTPAAEISHGQPRLLPEFETRLMPGRRLITLEIAPVYPSITIETGENFPSWQPPPVFRVQFQISRTRLPEPGSSETGPPPIHYPGWLPPPIHRFEFDRQHITLEFAPVYPATPPNTDQGYPAWLDVDTLRRDFTIKALSTGFIAFPVPPEKTAETFPAWLDAETLRREWDIRALVVGHNVFPETPPPPPPDHEGFPAWLPPFELRRDFDIKALDVMLAEYREAPPVFIFPKGSIIEQSFVARAIEQRGLIRKIEAS